MTKSLQEQLIEKGLVVLAGTRPKLKKAFSLQKCYHKKMVCRKCTLFRYEECKAYYGG